MMTKKNLAKAVTLSVLLMLPYGMAQAATFEYAITGGDDTYTDYRTYDESTNTYTYTLGDGAVLDLKTYYRNQKPWYFNTIGINANNENIIINGALDIKMQKGEGQNSGAVANAMLVMGTNSLLDRHSGGNIEVIGGQSVISVGGENNKLFAGDGNLHLKNTNIVEGNVISMSTGSNNLAVYGTGIITAESTYERDGYNRHSGVSMSIGAGNANKIILGYQGDYSDTDLAKFNNADNLLETVKDLGKVELNITATNTSETNTQEATAIGIELDRSGEESANAANNIIAAGDVKITTEAKTASDSGYSTNYSVGIEVKSDDSNITNIVALKSADIEASTIATNNAKIAAYGIWAESNGSNADALVEIAEKSNINVKSDGNNNFRILGIYAVGGDGRNLGESIVNTADIDITTNSTGGTVQNIALMANGGVVSVNGEANISANASGAAEGSKVYGLWSTLGGSITINGTTTISTKGGQAIAVVAGTEGWDEESADFENPLYGTNNINLNYGAGSDIKGDIISGYGGNITIGNAETGISTLSTRNNAGTLKLTGDALSANGGKLSINLTSGSTWTGRADDYQDADLKEQVESGFFNPKFSHDIAASGTVKVNLAQGAKWNVTGQSWVTELDGNGVINLTNGEGSDAVHIGTVKGSNTFVVNLKPDGLDTSDMLYIYDGSSAGVQNLRINNEAEVLNALKDDGDRIRFATVGKTAGAGAGFGDDYVVRGRGVINSGFSIDYVDYEEDKQNADYTTDYNGDNFDADKPGNSYVENVYGEANGADDIDSQNLYLVRDSSKDAGKSDSGATIINMSRANYKNAIYMDRLNKRMGEMRYVNGEEEQGLWVRLRHDRIGQSGDFRSMNTMYEVGYDVKQPTDNGEHRIGMAIDYMRGSTTYDDIMGKGETKRYGLWLYDTWLGEKGHYTDYIVKWGHLSNDFDIRDKDSLENITGDYSNNVFSVSAEYGKKNDMGNNWYFEPQAQLQLARVTGADYVTTQGSKVNVDGINSLIGRAGFRIGRDMDENSTVYLKADLLHEFMGDQTVTAADVTGTLREEFENKGTWYDVGFGFAAKMSKNSYAFMDFEKSFGNDNDETYQINAGVQWTF